MLQLLLLTPAWRFDTNCRSMNAYVSSNLGYHRPLTVPTVYQPASSMRASSPLLTDGPLSPQTAPLSPLSPPYERVSVKDYIDPDRHMFLRSSEDQNSRIPKK